MKKGIYFLLVLLTCCCYSCGTPDQEAQGEETTTTVQDKSTSTETANETNSSNATAPTEGGASKITDAIVGKVCDCMKGAKREDGTPDTEKMSACMGASSSTEYVANLLGPNSSDKERADAQNKLLERTANCLQ